MDQILHLLFGILGGALALFLFLSPVPTFRTIVDRRSTEHFSGIPYVVTLANCLLHLWYGLSLDSPNNLLVSTINGTGAVIESVYVLIFLVYATREEKIRIGGLLAVAFIIFVGVASYSAFALYGNHRKSFCGTAAALSSICMHASSLTAIAKVFETRGVEYMSFNLSFFGFLNNISWLTFGLLEKNNVLAIPNGIGCILGAIQMLVYAIFRFGIVAEAQDLEAQDSGTAPLLRPAPLSEEALDPFTALMRLVCCLPYLGN